MLFVVTGCGQTTPVNNDHVHSRFSPNPFVVDFNRLSPALFLQSVTAFSAYSMIVSVVDSWSSGGQLCFRCAFIKWQGQRPGSLVFTLIAFLSNASAILFSRSVIFLFQLLGESSVYSNDLISKVHITSYFVWNLSNDLPVNRTVTSNDESPSALWRPPYWPHVMIRFAPGANAGIPVNKGPLFRVGGSGAFSNP